MDGDTRPQWLIGFAWEISGFIRRHNAMPLFREMLRAWMADMEAQGQQLADWEKRYVQYVEKVRKTPKLRDGRAFHTNSVNGETDGGLKWYPLPVSGQDLWCWAPAEFRIRPETRPMYVFPLPPPADRGLTPAESYAALAAVHDLCCDGQEKISPWPKPGALAEPQDEKRYCMYRSLLERVGELKETDLPALKALLMGLTPAHDAVCQLADALWGVVESSTDWKTAAERFERRNDLRSAGDPLEALEAVIAEDQPPAEEAQSMREFFRARFTPDMVPTAEECQRLYDAKDHARELLLSAVQSAITAADVLDGFGPSLHDELRREGWRGCTELRLRLGAFGSAILCEGDNLALANNGQDLKQWQDEFHKDQALLRALPKTLNAGLPPTVAVGRTIASEGTSNDGGPKPSKEQPWADDGAPFYKPSYFTQWNIGDDLLRKNVTDSKEYTEGKVRRQKKKPSSTTGKPPAKGKRLKSKGRHRAVFWYSEPDARKRWPERFAETKKSLPKS